MVRQQSTAQDGDIVIAIIDGDSVTVKNYIEYDDGEVWLVPSNQRHVPIRPCDHQSCLIIGKVMSIEKSAPNGQNFPQTFSFLSPNRQKQAKLSPNFLKLSPTGLFLAGAFFCPYLCIVFKKRRRCSLTFW